MARYHKNEAIKVNYIALKKTLGLTDVYLQPYDETGALFGSPILMTEIPGDGSGLNSGGAYQGSFTPDADGQWRVRIKSVANGDDVQKAYEVDDYDIDDVKAQTQSIEDKTDIIDGNVDLIKAKTDKLPTDTAATLQSIKDVVDAIAAEIVTGGYIL